MKVLVLGASGMLGNAMMRVLSENDTLEVYGSVRSSVGMRQYFSKEIAANLIGGIDVTDTDLLRRHIDDIRPDVIINCIGITKHLSNADDPLLAIPVNALLPHHLARICHDIDCRVIHISTDCVFSGSKGGYTEDDKPDVSDIYGLSKYLGELHGKNTITLRTSIIGHELNTKYGLLEWFLSQDKQCKGFTRAIFSGFPTVVLARIIRDIVIPKQELYGLYHVASQPISKYDLLGLVAKTYSKSIELIPDDQLVIDRSLDSSRFRSVTGYVAPDWPELINVMHSYQ